VEKMANANFKLLEVNLMPTLVIGGAGYIGSHMVKYLADKSYDILVLDDLSTGHSELVGGHELIVGCMGDKDLLNWLFKKYKIDAVFNFAASSQVAESNIEPLKYYKNNVANLLNLLEVMTKYKVNYLIFSSSASVYGNAAIKRITEECACKPISVYGKTKLFSELIIEDFCRQHGLNAFCLRYFNAAGADPEARIGELHEPETHIIPLVLRAASGRVKEIKIFGNDYETFDGTCIRDYVHVLDLALAHEKALQYLYNFGGGFHICNVGTGTGYSITQIIDMAQLVANRSIKTSLQGRRIGDPAQLIADPTLISKKLNWNPVFSDLRTIIQHAWEWEKKFA
jgi:UDP-glucose 4-epimerase